jgi:hypothetical protein
MAAKHEHGLFVWTEANRYPRSAALKVYKLPHAAQRAADARNARGEHGGMLVVRPLDRVAPGETRPNPRGARRRARRNAPLEATPAHITRRGVLMSRNVLALTYYHALSKQRLPYKHEFASGVEMWAQPDGSIVLRHPSKRLWEDRNVSEQE